MSFVPVRQLCGVAGLPRHVTRLKQRLSRDGIEVVLRDGEGGPAWHCRKSALPEAVRSELIARRAPGIESMSAKAEARWYAATNRERGEATDRHRVAMSVRQLLDQGRTLHDAARQVAAQEGCSAGTVKNVWRQVEAVPMPDWPAALLKEKRGPKVQGDNPDAALFFAAVCKEIAEAQSATQTLRTAYDRAVDQLGPALSYRQTLRRWRALDDVTRQALWRGLADATDRLTPHVAREKPAAAMELVSLDARQADVRVLFPGDAKPVRPYVVLAIDVHSGKRLGWRVARSEDRETIRALILDIEREHGLPDILQTDNGRANESLSGLSFRGKRREIADELARFFLSRIGVQAYHAAPYNGRAKPVEGTFKLDKLREDNSFFGSRRAYVGNDPLKRRKDATGHVTLAEFEAWYSEHCARENASTDRRGHGMDGRSYDRAFEDGLALRAAPPRQLSASQRRRARFDGVERTPDPKTGAIRANGAVFEAPDATTRGRLAGLGKVLVFFDPADLNADVTVTTLDGRMICEALPVKARTPFMDRGAVKAQFLSGTYQGDNARVAEALASCLDARARRGALPEIVTGNPFLDTRASLRVLDALGFVHDTCGIALVTGKPGVGKTRAAREYARRARNVWHVTILEGGRSPVMTLRTACAELGIATEVNWGVIDLHARIVQKLAGKRALLIVDEAQHLGDAGLDAFRQVFDASEMGLVLMGHTDLAGTVGKMPQLKSRLTRRVRLGAADPRGDVAVIAAAFGVKDRQSLELLTSFALLEGGLRNVLNTLRLGAMRAYGRAVETADIAESWSELELGEGA